MKFTPDKSRMTDSMGRMKTQMLFLELGYNTEESIYSLKEYHHTHSNGVLYPSLKLLYLEEEDVTEYQFATKYLLGWKHWQRICSNKSIAPYIEEWRTELELKVRAQAIRDIVASCASEKGNFQAAKWLADKGWEKRTAGRPSKQEIERQKKINDRLDDEFGEDIARMAEFRRG